MSIKRVREFLAPLGLDHLVMAFEVSSATVSMAAAAAGIPEAQIAKTLAFHGTENTTILVVCAGDTRIDNPKFKAAFGVKAKMLRAEEAQERTGHAVGGVCPFALGPGVRVYLDDSLKRFTTIYPSAGNDRSAIKLTPAQLEQATTGTWVDVCKLMDG
ncbi:MAG: YbaK/EbsC family protein [Clostridiales bacterium]|nr:YbaK/EbsC family protein [Clostridiales bacterium]